jgi:hypothetical protein
MKEILFSFFTKKEKQSNLEPTTIKTIKVVYPFEGYEKLTLNERFKVIGDCVIENKMVLKK